MIFIIATYLESLSYHIEKWDINTLYTALKFSKNRKQFGESDRTH